MTSLILLTLLQSIISVEAGRVNEVVGQVNVPVNENVAEGASIRTGEDGYVEVLLNPGSFFRLGENSEAVLEETDLDRIRIRLHSGTGILEANELEAEFPITVLTGDLETTIRRNGLYRFADGQASVLEGELSVPGRDLAWEKGWSLRMDRVLRAAPNPDTGLMSGLDSWSAGRADLLARANTAAYRTALNTEHILPGTSLGGRLGNSWIWVADFGSWTFFPTSRYRSPYGYRYYSTTDLVQFRSQRESGVRSSGGSTSRPSTGSSGSDDSPSGGGGGGVSLPAPTFGDIVPAKSGPGQQQQN